MRRLLAASRRRDGCPPSTACLARWRTVAESLGHQHHQIRDYPAFGGSLRHHVGTIKYVGIPYLPSSPPARCSGRAVRAVCSRVTPKIHCIGLHLLVPRARGRIAHETLPVGRPAPSRACVRTVRKTPTLAAHRLVCAPTTALTTGALTACFAVNQSGNRLRYVGIQWIPPLDTSSADTKKKPGAVAGRLVRFQIRPRWNGLAALLTFC